MKNKLLNLLLLTLLFIGQSAYATEPLSAKRFDPKASEKADSLYNQAHRAYSNGNYEKAIELYKESYEYKPSADVPNNLAATYEKIKDYENAIKWYKVGVEKFNDKASAFNLGKLFKKKKEYIGARQLFEKSFEMGYWGGANSLAVLYEELDNKGDAITWYKKAIKKGHINARKNLGLLYHNQNDNLNSAVYMIAMIGHPYSKERVLGLLRNDWKIDEATIKKAYQLQKTLVPNPYYDEEFEDTPKKKKRAGRR